MEIQSTGENKMRVIETVINSEGEEVEIKWIDSTDSDAKVIGCIARILAEMNEPVKGKLGKYAPKTLRVTIEV